ncbi:MAG TPA: PQQ-dependent sugar dehydrogenase [Bdellovibrio sp.]|uniref:PQQ-dependent sugar dehydrogenase n=1 Tax=Bdellovibrio sp. TaxID=28201 RepID=UPI002F03B289
MNASLFFAIALMSSISFAAVKLPLAKLKMPPGFHISVFAEVPNARSIAQSPDGRIFVGTRTGDKVYMIENGKVSVFAEGLKEPNGVAVKDGKLYVAEIPRILEFNLPRKITRPQKPLRALPQTFPSDEHHGWKFIRFGPDGQLYVPVGANCNICETGTDYGRIYRIDVNGKSKEMVAQGVRNTVGFDWDPQTKDLWFTDNGRDMLGDDMPPDEVNHLTKVGEHFGYPYCHGKNLKDPEFGKKDCAQFTPPVVELRAHVAALGMRFYTGSMFPPEYRNGIILAEHGSWNRTQPQGYRLTFVKLKDGKPIKVEGFIEGWLQGDEAWGRPVDVEVLKDGSLLVSDDKAGVIYRVTYKGK